MLALLALAASALSACTPTPEPTPTPTAAFASEDEAFAAAEEVYRAFTSAVNEVNLAEPSTFEPLYDLSSGSFEAADRKTYSTMHAENYTISGTTAVLTFVGAAADEPFGTVVANICLDVSDVDVVDADGVSQVNPNRPDVYALAVTFVQNEAGQLLIDSAERIEDSTCVAP